MRSLSPEPSIARIVVVLIILLSAGPRLFQTLAQERASHVLLHALSLDYQESENCLGEPGLVVRNWAALAEAREQWQKVADTWPESQSRFRQLGMLALAQGKRSEAAQNFVLADHPVSRLWLARIAAGDERFEDAGHYLAQDYPTAWRVLLEKAGRAALRGDTTEALTCYRIVAHWDAGGEASALIARGHVRQGLGQYTVALSDFDRAIARCPTCYQAYLYRGQTLLVSGAGTLDAVEADFLRAVTLAPDQRDAALQWGHWLLNRQRWGEAEAQFKKWAQRNPAELESVLNLAYIYCNTGRQKEGRLLLAEFMEGFPVPPGQSDRVRQQLEQCQESVEKP